MVKEASTDLITARDKLVQVVGAGLKFDNGVGGAYNFRRVGGA